MVATTSKVFDQFLGLFCRRGFNFTANVTSSIYFKSQHCKRTVLSPFIGSHTMTVIHCFHSQWRVSSSNWRHTIACRCQHLPSSHSLPTSTPTQCATRIRLVQGKQTRLVQGKHTHSPSKTHTSPTSVNSQCDRFNYVSWTVCHLSAFIILSLVFFFLVYVHVYMIVSNGT